MMNIMRTSRSRYRTGSDPEVSVKRESGKSEKKQNSTRFIPANGQLSGGPNGKKLSNDSDTTPPYIKNKRLNAAPPPTIRRETVSRSPNNASSRQTGAHTRPPVTRRSPTSKNIPLTRNSSRLGLRRPPPKRVPKTSTPKSSNLKSNMRDLPPSATTTLSPPLQPVTMQRAPSKIMQRQHQYYGSKRSSRSEGSVGSMKSFRKSLGFRPKRVPRKITPHVSDDWSFFTFNTMLPASQKRRLLEQKQKGESPGFLTTCFGNTQTSCSAIGHSLVEDCNAIGSHTSLCLLGAWGILAGGAFAICNVVSMKKDIPEVGTVTTMDDFIARTKAKDEAYAKMLSDESRQPSQSDHRGGGRDDEGVVRISPRSVMQESRVSKYCVEATMKPAIQQVDLPENEQVVANSQAPGSRAQSINYSWENLDDESLVERSVVPQTPPNKVMIGRKLIDYDDLTMAYNQAERTQSELDDPGCFEGCFQWDDEFEEHGDERTVETYPEPSYSDDPRRRYDGRGNASTVMEVDELTQGPSVGATLDGTYMYDARDERSLESEDRINWRSQ